MKTHFIAARAANQEKAGRFESWRGDCGVLRVPKTPSASIRGTYGSSKRWTEVRSRWNFVGAVTPLLIVWLPKRNPLRNHRNSRHIRLSI